MCCLRRLLENDILVKTPYVQRQERYEYRLTEKGLALYPILMSMANWADEWMNEGFGKPMQYIHKSCGHKITPRLVCSECNETLHAKQVKPELTQDYFNYLE